MMPESPPPPAPRRGIIPWLVGLFALWQFAFVPLTNLLEFVPLRPTRFDTDPPNETTQRWGRFTDVETLQKSVEVVGYVLAGWGEVTGQEQGWNMFTPAFPPYTVVPVAEFHFPDGTTDRIHSRFEPADPANPPPRVPMLHDREFNYEANIVMPAWDCDAKAIAENPEKWRRLPEKVRGNANLIYRWLDWRLRQYRAAHPDRPAPTEVVLVLRYLPTPLPDGQPDVPPRTTFERPFARWRPGDRVEAGYMPLEGYDPVARRYVRLKEY